MARCIFSFNLRDFLGWSTRPVFALKNADYADLSFVVGIARQSNPNNKTPLIFPRTVYHKMNEILNYSKVCEEERMTFKSKGFVRFFFRAKSPADEKSNWVESG